MEHALPLHRQLHSSGKGFHLISRSQFYNFRVCEVVHLNGNIYYDGGMLRTCCLHICESCEKNLHKLFSYAVTMALCIYCTWKEALLHAHMQSKANNGHQIGSRMNEWMKAYMNTCFELMNSLSKLSSIMNIMLMYASNYN